MKIKKHLIAGTCLLATNAFAQQQIVIVRQIDPAALAEQRWQEDRARATAQMARSIEALERELARTRAKVERDENWHRQFEPAATNNYRPPMFANSPSASALFDQKVAQREGQPTANRQYLAFLEKHIEDRKRWQAKIGELWK